MRARTTLFIAFLAAAFVLATVSHGFAFQATAEQQPGYQQNRPNSPGNNSNFSNDLSNSVNPQNNQAGSPNAAPGVTPPSDIQPGVGNTTESVAPRHVPWGWLLLGEIVTLSMLAGAALVLVALVLVMKH